MPNLTGYNVHEDIDTNAQSYDHVRCMNCDYVGLVNLGDEHCPKCKGEGCLCWVDEDNPEVDC